MLWVQKKKKVSIQKSRRNLRVQEQDEEEFTVVKGSCSVTKGIKITFG